MTNDDLELMIRILSDDDSVTTLQKIGLELRLRNILHHPNSDSFTTKVQ